MACLVQQYLSGVVSDPGADPCPHPSWVWMQISLTTLSCSKGALMVQGLVAELDMLTAGKTREANSFGLWYYSQLNHTAEQQLIIIIQVRFLHCTALQEQHESHWSLLMLACVEGNGICCGLLLYAQHSLCLSYDV